MYIFIGVVLALGVVTIVLFVVIKVVLGRKSSSSKVQQAPPNPEDAKAPDAKAGEWRETTTLGE